MKELHSPIHAEGKKINRFSYIIVARAVMLRMKKITGVTAVDARVWAVLVLLLALALARSSPSPQALEALSGFDVVARVTLSSPPPPLPFHQTSARTRSWLWKAKRGRNTTNLCVCGSDTVSEHAGNIERAGIFKLSRNVKCRHLVLGYCAHNDILK